LIVLDASVLIEWLLATPRWEQVEARIVSSGESWHAPHLVDLEVVQVLRRFVSAGLIRTDRALEALSDLRDAPLIRYPHERFLHRVWELRNNLTAYDAVYVALAEALEAPLVTCDGKLASASGHHARVEVIE